MYILIYDTYKILVLPTTCNPFKLHALIPKTEFIQIAKHNPIEFPLK